jgi:hypothetical protein
LADCFYIYSDADGDVGHLYSGSDVGHVYSGPDVGHLYSGSDVGHLYSGPDVFYRVPGSVPDAACVYSGAGPDAFGGVDRP